MNPTVNPMNCPVCKRKIEKSDPEFPFCSERCRNEDLGNWIYGRYPVPVPMSDEQPIPDQRAEPEPGDKDGK